MQQSSQNEIWTKMTDAEKLVQRRTGFTWNWMNTFQQSSISSGLISMAEEILQLRKRLKITTTEY